MRTEPLVINIQDLVICEHSKSRVERDRLSVFIAYEKTFRRLAIGVDAGIGLALVKHQDIMYAFLDSSITLAWQIASCFSLNFRTGFVYYRQRFEIQPGIGACLILPPGDRK